MDPNAGLGRRNVGMYSSCVLYLQAVSTFFGRALSFVICLWASIVICHAFGGGGGVGFGTEFDFDGKLLVARCSNCGSLWTRFPMVKTTDFVRMVNLSVKSRSHPGSERTTGTQ